MGIFQIAQYLVSNLLWYAGEGAYAVGLALGALVGLMNASFNGIVDTVFRVLRALFGIDYDSASVLWDQSIPLVRLAASFGHLADQWLPLTEFMAYVVALSIVYFVGYGFRFCLTIYHNIPLFGGSQ